MINLQGVLSNPNLALDAAKAGTLDQLGRGLAARVDARALDDARRSGLTCLCTTVGHVAGAKDPRAVTLDDINAWDAFISTHPAQLLKVTSTPDVAAARASQRVGVIYAFQNTEMLGANANSVDEWAQRGVRVMQLTYNGRNRVADGCMVAQDGGISVWGYEVLARMNHLRVLVDLSHSSENTCMDALRASAAPVVISHTGCRALADWPRNKSDAELRALADRGGVVGIYGMPFLRQHGQPMAQDLLAHIEHAIRVCGEDHVGLGTDGSITGVDDIPNYMHYLARDCAERQQSGVAAAGETPSAALFLPDLCGPGQFQTLAELLQQRGHRSARVEKILGGNVLRLLRDVWGG